MGDPAGRGHLPGVGVYLLPGAARGRESGERRRQATHPAAVKPELAASGPNQVYSWDITKLHGPAKWTYYHLSVILDIYSRYAVGWTVATRESAALAEKLIAMTCAKQGIARGQLSIHADRGSSMTSKPVALLLAVLGVTQSHSRPHVSNDNPYSEAQFKTPKYRPAFPARFPSIEAARAHEALGVSEIGGVQDLGASGPDGCGPAVVDIGGGVQAKAAVMMLVVVQGEEVLAVP